MKLDILPDKYEERSRDLLGSLAVPPDIRARLHAICALYAHSRTPKGQASLLDLLELMTLEAAQLLATDLLDNGWRPDDEISPSTAGKRREAPVGGRFIARGGRRFAPRS